jgi:acyl carrier protein
VVATSGAVDPNAPEGAVPTIGWPIRNTRIHLLDEQMRKVAPGTPGEIYIESASIARGYRNSPQLTAERFLPNPFYDESTSPDPQNPAEFARRRLYRTGDLARELPDGQLVFLGRVDDQVKIRGNRIEPQEIVAWLNRHPAVKESRVIAQAEGPGTGEKRLIAYLCATPGAAPTPSELRKWLSEHLPEYMIPAAFVRVEAFPLTPNGKIDVAALPPPGPDNVLEEPRTGAPRTPMEQHVAQMIGNLLKLDHIEAEDNFFLLGGHSMLGAQLIARINQDFQAQITLRDLFAAPTVRALAREIERALANAKSAAAAQSAGFTQQDKGGGR